jgi:hypothetical protein
LAGLPRIPWLRRAFHCFWIFAGLLLILSVEFWSAPPPLKVGQVSPRDVIAPRTVEVENERATQSARQEAAERVEPQYAYDPMPEKVSERKVEDTFAALKKMAAAYQNLPTEESEPEIERLKKDIPYLPKNSTLTVLLISSPETLQQLETTTRQLLWKVQHNGVREDRLAQARQTIASDAEKMPQLGPEQVVAVTEIANGCLLFNMSLDMEATIREQQAAMNRVEPVRKIIQKGYKIVGKGEMVAPEHLREMQELGLHSSWNVARFGGYALLVISMMTLVALYLRRQQKAIYESDRMLALTGFLVIAVAATTRSLTGLSPYLAPVVTASILLVLLVEARLALMVTVFLSALIGVETENLAAAIVSLLTGVSGLLAVSRAQQRASLITASLVVVFTNALGALTFSLIASDDLNTTLNALAFASLNGLTSTLVAVGALPLLENLFGITTNFRLLEISNPSEPLLQKLLKEAPGTYQHSIMVANLAESAAQAVGADALLCKVGAYYHDIGKIKRPRFFVENQTGQDNPHDRLNPNLSTLIIISHVKDGLELARQYKLPDVIQRFIAEHHGTSLVSYFYHQAISRATEPVFEEDFRYHGPKPTLRETGIVMLCDGIEAAARTLPSPTPEAITELVHKMTRQCLEDGQLDECDLSFKDITAIRESLIRSLKGIYHTRIEYPEPSSLASPRRQNVTSLRKKA